MHGPPEQDPDPGAALARLAARPAGIAASSAALFVVYVALAELSYAFFVIPPANNAVFWLPSGVNFALFVRARASPRLWPGWLLAVALAELVVVRRHGVPWGVGAAWALAAGLLPLAAALLARRAVQGPLALRRLRDVLVLTVLVLASAVPGAVLAATAGALGLGAPLGPMALAWGTSDALGVLLLAPVVLAWTAPQHRPAGGRLEALGLVLVLVALVARVLVPRAAGLAAAAPSFLLFVVAWASIRFGPRATTLTLLALDVALVGAAITRTGPFAGESSSPAERLLDLQLLAANGGLLMLVLAAAIEEQRSATALAHEARGEAERVAGENARLYEQVREALQDRERVVVERTAELLAANDELEAFSYSVSHDLRAPLRAVNGFARALEEDCGAALGPLGADYVERIRAASARMDALISSLLELSRIARVDLQRAEVDLSALARELGDELAQASPGRDVQLVVAPGLVARADRGLARVVLGNLLANAWKFTARRASARVEVGARPSPEGPDLYFVRDDGAGFDPRYAAKLFSPFERLHGADEFPGTGIGLATVQRAVKRHGGRVWGESAPGQGATFWFTLAG